MYLKILGHPILPNLNFHMPMIVDLSHPLIVLQGENGSGKSSLFEALRGLFKHEFPSLFSPKRNKLSLPSPN